jgi:hypothetical protein
LPGLQRCRGRSDDREKNITHLVSLSGPNLGDGRVAPLVCSLDVFVEDRCDMQCGVCRICWFGGLEIHDAQEHPGGPKIVSALQRKPSEPRLFFRTGLVTDMVHSCGSLLLICCQDIGDSSMALELALLLSSFRNIIPLARVCRGGIPI